MMGFTYRDRFSASGDGPARLPGGRLFEKLETIAIFRDSFHAYLSKYVLDSAGIDCFICDEHTGTTKNLFASKRSGFRLKVRESEAAKAVDVLLRDSEEE